MEGRCVCRGGERHDDGRLRGGGLKEPRTPIAPQLRRLSLPWVIVPGVINAQPSFQPLACPPRRPDVPVVMGGTMAEAECPAQRQQLHSRVGLCSLPAQWPCVTPSHRPPRNNLFIDAISLSLAYLRMPFHKCMEIEIILCFPPPRKIKVSAPCR